MMDDDAPDEQFLSTHVSKETKLKRSIATRHLPSSSLLLNTQYFPWPDFLRRFLIARSIILFDDNMTFIN